MKTFFLDIDGVIYKNGIINEDVLQTIKNKNNKYVFCTGRGYSRCLDIVKKYIDIDDEIILENGGQIIKNSKTIYYDKISKNIKKVLKYIQPQNIEHIIFASKENNEYYSYGNKHLLHVKKQYVDFKEFLNLVYSSNLCQITMKFKDENSQKIFLAICEKYNIEYKLSENYVIINNKGTSKKTAIEYLIKKNKLAMSDCIIVGNDYNDIDMYNINCYKKIGVIDDNTPEEIKIKATDLVSFEELPKLINTIIYK